MKKLSQINEGLLGGIQKRVMNGESRKEDDVNLMSQEEFEKYLESHYKYFGKFGDGMVNYRGNGDLALRVAQWSPNVIQGISAYYRNDSIYFISINVDIREKSPEFGKWMDNNFKTRLVHGCNYHIESEDNELTNKTILNILDAIIKMVPGVIIKRK